MRPPVGAQAAEAAGGRAASAALRLALSPPLTDRSDVPDVLVPGLRAVFCGINPGRVSAAAQAHFANPRNDFWRLLHEAGFTPRQLAPSEQFDLPLFGYGLTNAAYRTTPGSGDLRRADFEGSAERLERIARDLYPGAIAFVGKEAYRGAFGDRPELGLQARRLAETALFVLPSTSPANAAVPYSERLRWFRELRELIGWRRLRPAARAIVLDPDDRVLLTRYDFGDRSVWAGPGGGIEDGESAEDAMRRELREELDLEVELGPRLWTRNDRLPSPDGEFDAQVETYFLVRVEPFDPAPRLVPELYMTAARWWTVDEIEASDAIFGPRRLAELLRELLTIGPPAEPFEIDP